MVPPGERVPREVHVPRRFFPWKFFVSGLRLFGGDTDADSDILASCACPVLQQLLSRVPVPHGRTYGFANGPPYALAYGVHSLPGRPDLLRLPREPFSS